MSTLGNEKDKSFFDTMKDMAPTWRKSDKEIEKKEEVKITPLN